LEQEGPLKKIIRASQIVNLKHLAMLAEADARGRVSPNSDDNLERVRLFAQYAVETGCYGRAYPFESDSARITYLKSDNGLPTCVPCGTTWDEVILMSGLPGAGKDTWISANAGYLPMISLDKIRVELGIGPEQNQGRVIQKAKARAKALLRNKTPFVWNATNITAHVRQPLIDLFIAYGAKVKIVYVELTHTQLIRQNADRPSNVPKEVLNRLIGKLEVPTSIEAHKVHFICPYHSCRSTFHQLDVCLIFLYLVRHHRNRLCGIRFYAAFPAWVPIA
jgi:predicted kinase